MYFETDVLLQVGTPVEVSLRIPQELAGRMANDIKCTARVVHVRPSAQGKGKVGVGLHIERYESAIRVLDRDRWAS